MHLSLDRYLLALRGLLPWQALLQEAHHHLLDLCPECRAEWDGTSPPFRHLEDGALQASELAESRRDRRPNRRDFTLGMYDRAVARRGRLRAIARDARRDLARLDDVPVDEWPDRVRRSRTRYRSRTCAVMLLDELEEAHSLPPFEGCGLGGPRSARARPASQGRAEGRLGARAESSGRSPPRQRPAGSRRSPPRRLPVHEAPSRARSPPAGRCPQPRRARQPRSFTPHRSAPDRRGRGPPCRRRPRLSRSRRRARFRPLANPARQPATRCGPP